ncbi:Vps62-related protein [Streptomyces sp. G-G2]|uniref:Vps62-related protein n=1 Tax=Streptomyces sp. G-G2 TaxID=3046201 RepID=UPI0024B9FD66|nr:Vps62-related protein [Streptomyces sp. G-G2]MDJ0384784.1 Vps62-related protein [Streptomyces sp. G-G2]
MVDSIRYGALDIAVTDRFTRRWDDAGSGATLDGAFFNPEISSTLYAQGWRYLGSTGHRSHADMTGARGAILVRGANAADQMIKPPVRFDLIWTDEKSGAKKNGSVWRPVAPPGYVALGDVWAALSWDAPLTEYYACVRQELAGRRYVREGVIGDMIWDDKKSGARRDVSTWQIRPPQYPTDSTERLILGADLHRAHASHARPSGTVHVLDLPAAVARRNPPAVPVLTSHREPDPVAQITDRAVTVPMTVVKDPGKNIAWQAANSPFYTLERRVNFTLQIFRNNEAGSTPAESSVAVTTGITKEMSEEFSRRTSTTVSASAGIEIKGLSASVETSVTTELGYSSRHSVTQLNSVTKTHGLTTPARSSGALWSATHEIIAIRRNGEAVGGQGGLKFDVDSYFTGQYPRGAQAQMSTEGVGAQEGTLAQAFGETGEPNVPDAEPQGADADEDPRIGEEPRIG